MKNKREQQQMDSEEIVYFAIVGLGFTLVVYIISTLYENFIK